MGRVYFLELHGPDGNPITMGNRANPRAQASLYCGYTGRESLQSRLREHNAGRGARITRAGVTVYGGQWRIVAAVPGTRQTERQIKARKNHRRYLQSLAKREATERSLA